MKVAMIVIGSVLGILGTIVLVFFLMYQSAHDNAVDYEATIERLNKESEGTLSAVTQKIQTAIGVTGIYTDDLKAVVQASMEGRYGDNGSRAVFNWIQEQNPVFDSSLYLKIQNIVDGGQSEFLISQQRKLEVCKTYEALRGYLIRGAILTWMGFPKKDIDKMCVVISDANTREAFDTGLQKPLITR